jgi:hypothetical protein
MYVPIMCVSFCAKERQKEIVPQQRSSVIYLVNDCGHQHEYTRNYYLDLQCPETLLTNDFHLGIYIVFFWLAWYSYSFQ